MKRFFIFILLMSFVLAQEFPPLPSGYWGYLTENSNPVENLLVIVKDSTGQVGVANSETNSEGLYSLEVLWDNLNTPEDEGVRDGETIYFYADNFVLSVKKDSTGHYKYGFVDKKGEIRIDYNYDEANHFDDYGYARVKVNGNLYLIDTLGNHYPLAESIKTLTSTTLALSLNEQLLDKLPPEILKNPQLKILYLRGNRLKNLPDELMLHQSLLVLDLGYNELLEAPDVLTYMPHIKILDLENNNLDSFDIPLTDISELETLDLSFNTIGTVPAEIRRLQRLIHLDISYNNLYDLDAAITKIPTLQKLNLYQNSLDTIPEELLTRTTLMLNIGGNRMRSQRDQTLVQNKRKRKPIQSILI